jgi:hypothetical protein
MDEDSKYEEMVPMPQALNRDSMSTARQSRNKGASLVVHTMEDSIVIPDGLKPEPTSNCSEDQLRETMSGEPTRLMKAEAVLSCVGFALLRYDWFEEGANRPCFSDAIDAACDLVREAVRRFDVPCCKPQATTSSPCPRYASRTSARNRQQS